MDRKHLGNSQLIGIKDGGTDKKSGALSEAKI